jgi:hypothetical protein
MSPEKVVGEGGALRVGEWQGKIEKFCLSMNLPTSNPTRSNVAESGPPSCEADVLTPDFWEGIVLGIVCFEIWSKENKRTSWTDLDEFTIIYRMT